MNRTKISAAYAGDIYGNDTFVVVSQTRAGNRYILKHTFPTAERADKFAARVQRAGLIDLDHWVDHTPVYGSPAWEAESVDAFIYAEGLRGGLISEDDLPGNVRTLL